MSNRILIDCPLGSRCSGNGRHYQDSDTYRTHQEMANRGGGASAEDKRKKYNDAANPRQDVSGDDYTDYSDVDVNYEVWENPALMALGAAAWAGYLQERHGKTRFKMSALSEIRHDEEDNEFVVHFKTGDSILFKESVRNDGHFTAVRFDENGDEISKVDLPPEEVEKYIKKEDKEEAKKYTATIAGTAAVSYAGSSYMRHRKKAQQEKAAVEASKARQAAAWARSPLFSWMGKLFDGLTPWSK